MEYGDQEQERRTSEVRTPHHGRIVRLESLIHERQPQHGPVSASGGPAPSAQRVKTKATNEDEDEDVDDLMCIV